MRLVNNKTYPLNLQQLVFGHLGTEVEPNTGKLLPFSLIKLKELPILANKGNNVYTVLVQIDHAAFQMGIMMHIYYSLSLKALMVLISQRTLALSQEVVICSTTS